MLNLFDPKTVNPVAKQNYVVAVHQGLGPSSSGFLFQGYKEPDPVLPNETPPDV